MKQHPESDPPPSAKDGGTTSSRNYEGIRVEGGEHGIGQEITWTGMTI